MCHTISFSTEDIILAQMITTSSRNPRALSSRSALVKYFILLSFFSFIRLLYLSVMHGLAGFKLSEFVILRPRCCRFMTVSYLIPLQLFDCSARVTFAVLVFTSFFDIMPSFPLYMLLIVGILLELYAIRIFPLSLIS